MTTEFAFGCRRDVATEWEGITNTLAFHLLLIVCVCVFTCAGLHMPWHEFRGQRTSSVLIFTFHSETGSLLFCLQPNCPENSQPFSSPPPSSWWGMLGIQTFALLLLASPWILESEFRLSGSCCKCFKHWAVSSATMQFLKWSPYCASGITAVLWCLHNLGLEFPCIHFDLGSCFLSPPPTPHILVIIFSLLWSHLLSIF